MLDKNGKEIRTGDVVVISGSFFKGDNAMYKVQYSPGQKGWSGQYYSLQRLNKNGSFSTRKYNLCFWPLAVMVNDYFKTVAAKKHNAEFAEIEVIDFEKF